MSIFLIHFTEFPSSLHRDQITWLSSGNTHKDKIGEHLHHQSTDGLQGFRFTILHLQFKILLWHRSDLLMESSVDLYNGTITV